jgi:psp operon transcriptional activator
MEALPPIPGEDPAFLDVIERISALAGVEKPCLIVGERGTGKELFTTRLHYLSRRWDRELIKVNCAALAESLLDTELFGHEAGAFTGAVRRHVGCFERADGGTLVLDEIASASLNVQEKILRVIEYGEFQRVGGSETTEVDVRIVAASNLDLPALASRNEFRPDLLDRLAFDVITLPPLRARPADILPLAHGFGIEIARDLGRDAFPGFTPEAEAALQAYDWPGNVRELKNVVERSFYRSLPEAPVSRLVFDPFASPWRPGGALRLGLGNGVTPTGASASNGLSSDDPLKARTGESPASVITPDSAASPDSANACVDAAGVPFAQAVAAFETARIREALARSNGNQTVAARDLGLNYHQLRRLVKKHSI